MIKVIRNSILIILGSAFIGTILLTLCFMLPINHKNVTESELILEKEGWYPAVPVLSQSLDTHFHSLLPGVLDNSTDKVMLEISYGDSEGSVLRRAMNMYTTSIGGGYPYYWHGYVSILKPLLLFFDYGEIRIINSFLQILLIMVLVHMVWKNKGFVYVMVLLTSYMLLMPVSLSLSLQFSWVFYISIIGCLILLKYQQYFEVKNRIFYGFLVLGILTSYFDLLTYPLYTWAFPLIWWIIMSHDNISTKNRLKMVVTTGLLWIFGYGGMWVLKWILANIVLKENIFLLGINEVFFRTSTEGRNPLLNRIQAITLNWKHYTYKIYFIIIASWLVWFFIQSFWKRWKTDSRALPLALVGISPIVWYMVLSNHTLVHHFYTYRIFGISVLAVFAILAGSLSQQKEIKLMLDGKHLLRIISVWFAIALLAGGIAMQTKEELYVHNGAQAHRSVILSEGSTVDVEFTPSFSKINKISFCIETESLDGSYDVLLYKDGSLLQQESVLVEDLDGKSFFDIPVEWKVKRGDAYQIQIQAHVKDKETYIFVTQPEEEFLAEYSQLYISGEEVSGCLISGIGYKRRSPIDMLFFWEITWVGILLAGVIVTSNCFKPIKKFLKMI